MRFLQLLCRSKLTFGVLLLVLLCSCATVAPRNLIHRPLATNFMGLELGMKSDSVIRMLHQDPDALTRLRFIAGKRILHDSVNIWDCGITLFRSIGFDSSNLLRVVGLTCKTTPDKKENVSNCALWWLNRSLGDPLRSSDTSGIRTSEWTLINGTVTLEARSYNPDDFFILIYYYKP